MMKPARATQSLPGIVGERARLRPDATAVVDASSALTYGELERFSSNVAQNLVKEGVRPGDRVGLFVERDVETVICLVAILKCGAAYVPVDASYPAERVEHILTDSMIDLIVSPSETNRVCVGHARVVSRAQLSLPPTSPTSESVNPASDSAAYVIYTSGSTGRPKGCVVTHANVLALLSAACPLYEFSESDRWSVFHSFCFDFSVWELWGAFYCGAAAVLVPWEAAVSTEEFMRLLRVCEVTVLNLVPTVFHYVLAEWREAAPATLKVRYLILGGEAVRLDDVALFLESSFGARVEVVNMYGITENTVHSTFKRLRIEEREAWSNSPIGLPLDNVGLHLLDANGTQVRQGDVGEIWLTGTGVASGYLNNESLTKERFASVCLDGSDVPLRSYRTGDLARQLPNGEFDYLGRADSQVKIRGYRVELEEIEVALSRLESVVDATVCAVDVGTGTKLLALVASSVAPSREFTASIRRALSRTLPSYMIPDRLEITDSLPLTPSGKRDRAAAAAQLTHLAAG